MATVLRILAGLNPCSKKTQTAVKEQKEQVQYQSVSRKVSWRILGYKAWLIICLSRLWGHSAIVGMTDKYTQLFFPAFSMQEEWKFLAFVFTFQSYFSLFGGARIVADCNEINNIFIQTIESFLYFFLHLFVCFLPVWMEPQFTYSFKTVSCWFSHLQRLSTNFREEQSIRMTTDTEWRTAQQNRTAQFWKKVAEGVYI